MLSRCQAAARTSSSTRAGAEGGNKAVRVCDLPDKKSGSLARQGQDQGQDQVEGQWWGSALVQWQPCQPIIARLVQDPDGKSSWSARIRVGVRTKDVFGLDSQSCNEEEMSKLKNPSSQGKTLWAEYFSKLSSWLFLLVRELTLESVH